MGEFYLNEIREISEGLKEGGEMARDANFVAAYLNEMKRRTLLGDPGYFRCVLGQSGTKGKPMWISE